jgi:hypothetical protein
MAKTTRRAPKKAATKNLPSKKAATKKLQPKKAAPKRASKNSPTSKTALLNPAISTLKKERIVLYVDSSFFFPGDSEQGYIDDFQGGRYTLTPNQMLQAPILLPVGARIFTITMYYKNTSKEPMMVTYLKKHIDHHAFSGEVEVSFENLPPGTLPPDNYLATVINHFENSGVIRDKYLYFLQVQGTGKIDDEQIRTVRGMRIEYQV